MGAEMAHDLSEALLHPDVGLGQRKCLLQRFALPCHILGTVQGRFRARHVAQLPQIQVGPCVTLLEVLVKRQHLCCAGTEHVRAVLGPQVFWIQIWVRSQPQQNPVVGSVEVEVLFRGILIIRTEAAVLFGPPEEIRDVGKVVSGSDTRKAPVVKKPTGSGV